MGEPLGRHTLNQEPGDDCIKPESVYIFYDHSVLCAVVQKFH